MIATRDVVANLFSQPQFVATLGQAIRSFGDACQNKTDPNNILARHPRDFELWHIGEYDDEDGHIDNFGWDGTNQDDRKLRRQIAVGANYYKAE